MASRCGHDHARPAAAGPPGQQPPPPPPQDAAADAALVTAIAGALVTAVTVEAAIQYVKLRFKLSGYLLDALSGSLGIAMGSPPPVTGVVGPASAQTSRQNLARRAQFVVSSAKRLMSDVAAWRAKHTGPPPVAAEVPASAQAADLNVLRRGQFAEARRRRLQADIDAAENAGRMKALQDGLARERRYYGMHLAAMWQPGHGGGEDRHGGGGARAAAGLARGAGQEDGAGVPGRRSSELLRRPDARYRLAGGGLTRIADVSLGRPGRAPRCCRAGRTVGLAS